MPRYPVLQPDGKLAVWSTIVDTFVAIDCASDEAAAVLQHWYDNESRSELQEIVNRCAKGEQVYDWWWDWPKCVAWATFLHGESDGTVKLAMERTPDAMTRRYIKQYVMTCKAESNGDEFRDRAAAAEARVRELEAQIAGLLPAAQALVTSIEFIPIPASNAAADSALLTGTGETSGGNVHGPVKSAMLP